MHGMQIAMHHIMLCILLTVELGGTVPRPDECEQVDYQVGLPPLCCCLAMATF